MHSSLPTVHDLLEYGGRERASSLEGVDDLTIRLLGKCFHGRRSDIPEPTQHQTKSRRNGVVWGFENADKVVLSHRQIKRLHMTAHVRQHLFGIVHTLRAICSRLQS